MSFDEWLLSTTARGAVIAICAAGSVADPATAADAALPPLVSQQSTPTGLPAVSGFNAKWEALGGSLNGQTLAGSTGSLSAPLGRQFGLQLDILAASYGGDFLGGAAGHLFWRDPSVGLIGLYGSGLAWDRFGGIAAGNAAIEAERYWNRWSIGGIAGVEFGNAKTQTTPVVGGALVDSFDIKTRFFDQIDLSYYLTDNFKLSVGHAIWAAATRQRLVANSGCRPGLERWARCSSKVSPARMAFAACSAD
jgi:hypothetical protein